MISLFSKAESRMVWRLGGRTRLSMKLSKKAFSPMNSRCGGRVRLRSCLLSKA